MVPSRELGKPSTPGIREILGESIGRRDAVVRRRPLVGPEERRRVLTDERVNDVAVPSNVVIAKTLRLRIVSVREPGITSPAHQGSRPRNSGTRATPRRCALRFTLYNDWSSNTYASFVVLVNHTELTDRGERRAHVPGALYRRALIEAAGPLRPARVQEAARE